jgi:hypothetical protein
MRWIDDIVPFRYGGNNNRAGQQEIRYGPNRRDDAVEQSKRASMSNYIEKISRLHGLVEKFNSSNDASEKQEALKQLCARSYLHFEKFGKIPNDDNMLRYFLRKWKTKPHDYLLRISENQLVIKKLMFESTKTYITFKVFSIQSLILELRGDDNKKEWNDIHLEVHVILPKDEHVLRLRRLFRGW